VHQHESEGFVCAVQGDWGFVSASAREWVSCVCSKKRLGE
jgi:hypothetical protein